MEPPLKKLAIGAVRLAAMSQLGPLGGAVFLAGGALAGKLLAESEWAKAAADVFTVLATGKAADLLGYAVRGFREQRNGDLDKSMHKAAQLALASLQTEAPPEFADWFRDWDNYLTHTPSEVVFSGTGDADPVALQYDDDEFRALWWSRMEPALLRWRRDENSSLTQLNLSNGAGLPVTLRTLLRARLPEAMQAQHDVVLRDESLKRSWIGFQQHVYRETLDHLLEVRHQLDRIEAKLQQRGATTSVALHDLNCAPFSLIEHSQIFGLASLAAFAPTKVEYIKGLVHRPDLASAVEDRLESIGWALVRGRGASGKTVLATQIAFGPQFRDGSVFYLDLARLTSTNQSEMHARALDVITWRKGQRVLFIVDNVHLNEELTREIFDHWQVAPQGSRLLLMGRWTQLGPNSRGLAQPLSDLEREALTLEVTAADLVGVLRRISARAGLDNQLVAPPAEVMERWLALFGGDLIAFSAAIARRIRLIGVGAWELTAEDAVEYVRGAYLNPPDPLTDEERHSLLFVAALSRLEFALPSVVIKRGSLERSLRVGVVLSTEHGADRYRRFVLIHAGLGELLLSAADPPVSEQALYYELAQAAPGEAMILSAQLEKLGQLEPAIAVVRFIAQESGRLANALIFGGLGRTALHCEHVARLAVCPLEDIDSDLSLVPESLRKAALRTRLGSLRAFLDYAWRKLPKTYGAVIAALMAPTSQAQLFDAVLKTPLADMAPFLDYAQTRDDLKKAGKTIVAALSAPTNQAQLSNAALRTPLADIASLLNYVQTRDDLKEAGKTIVAALSAPTNQAQLAQTFLLTPLDKLVSFLRLSVNQKEAKSMVSGIVSAIDRTAWDRSRLAMPASQPDCTHAASGLFQVLGRPELMEAPARASILSADVPSWHAPGVSLHHLSQVLRLGHEVEPSALQSFIGAVATESWLAGQYRSASAGAIAAALYSIWAYHGDQTLLWFITDPLHARLRAEMNRFRRLPTPLLAGAIQLAGCCSVSGMVLPSAAAWPTIGQVDEVLTVAAPRVGMTEIGHVQVQLWLGLREVARLCSDEIRIPKQLAEQIRELWHNSKPTLERHVLVNTVMIPWLNRCSESGWVLIRAEESLHDRLRTANEALHSRSF